jgi:hypothetical protein
MKIEGMDYNTQREALAMSEYGREIQKMVDYCVSIADAAERQHCAETIVRHMETRVPQNRDNADFERTLWDHLYMMSRGKLEINWPYDMSNAETIHSKPEPLKYNSDRKRTNYVRHYGQLMAEMFEKLKTMPEGGEKDELVKLTANQMKRCLATWGQGSMDDEKVADDLARLTDGKVQLDLQTFVFDRIAHTAEPQKKSKKKR